MATEPSVLPGLGLEKLSKARGLLKRTRRLDSVLAFNDIHLRWLDQALKFRKGSTEDQVSWLAQRLGATWQRKEGLGANGAVERFELVLNDDFPLNLKSCSLVFPPTDWPEKDVLSSLGTGGDQVCLILSGNPDRLDRLMVYGLIERDDFTLGDVLEHLKAIGYDSEPERVKESLTRLELAFIVGRARNRFRWQVTLWREQVLAEEPALMLERELDAHGRRESGSRRVLPSLRGAP